VLRGRHWEGREDAEDAEARFEALEEVCSMSLRLEVPVAWAASVAEARTPEGLAGSQPLPEVVSAPLVTVVLSLPVQDVHPQAVQEEAVVHREGADHHTLKGLRGQGRYNRLHHLCYQTHR